MLLRFGGLLFIVVLVLWLYCLLDAITSDQDAVRTLPKVAWVLIVLFTFELGAVLWLVFGRPRRAVAGSTGTPGRGRSEAWSGTIRPFPTGGRPGQRAPDDDPEFLAGLNRRANDEHKQLLDQWEADLRRREDELRRREPDPDDESATGPLQAGKEPGLDSGREFGRESGRETGREAGEDGSAQPDEPGR
jgi:hypothetical protein